MENLGTKGSTRSLGELILEAGYEESMAKNPYQILGSETIQEGLKSTVDQMRKIRDKALKTLELKNLDEEKAKDISDIIDKLQKNIQLLSGEDTERVRYTPVLVKFLDERPKNNRDTD